MNDNYNFFAIQENLKSVWQNNSIFDCLSFPDIKPFFIVDTPPPTVSGNLHIGHVFSYIHQDIIVRYKRINGFNIIFPFGFDDNGLPTERYIEKKCGVSSKKLSKKEFTDICYSHIPEVHNKFASLWKNLGLSYNWNLLYSTISPEVQLISQKLFIDLYKKGYIYKKEEPALYCSSFQTSISQADLEEIEKETNMVTIRFKEKKSGADILIATTRPELLAGCVAVLINPDDNRFSHLIGKKAIVPIYNQEVNIIGDESVIIDKGTGIVMSATFGDGLDVHWFKKYNFPYIKIINKDGFLSEKTLLLSGLKVEAGRKLIIDTLLENNLITEQKIISHRVSIYERSKKEIEYIMLNQWFVSILPYKEELISIADKINWHPEYMKLRYIDWVKNLSWDWCISRQRSFGIPFPVWYDKNNNIIIPSEDTALPCNPEESLPTGYNKDNCYPDTDVMDTWNTSSITPYIIQKMLIDKDIVINFPFDMRPQSHDIIRTWAFDTIVKSYFLDKTIPWKNIVISGHVVTGDNEKISKSKENSPLDPENLLKKYPADVIRYWSASAKLGVDTIFSETQFKDGNKLIIKLFNAAICLKNFSDFDYVNRHNNINCKEECNIFFLSQYQNTLSEYHKSFEIFDFNSALKISENLFWFFCDYYLEIIKTYTTENNFCENSIKEVKECSAFLFFKILQLFSPFIPFIVDHIWNTYYQKTYKSIHLTQMDKNFNIEKHTNNDFNIIIKIINMIRKAKSDKKLSLKSSISKLYISDCSFIQLSYLEKTNIKNILLKMNYIKDLICLQNESEKNECKLEWINNEDNLELLIYIN